MTARPKNPGGEVDLMRKAMDRVQAYLFVIEVCARADHGDADSGIAEETCEAIAVLASDAQDALHDAKGGA